MNARRGGRESGRDSAGRIRVSGAVAGEWATAAAGRPTRLAGANYAQLRRANYAEVRSFMDGCLHFSKKSAESEILLPWCLILRQLSPTLARLAP